MICDAGHNTGGWEYVGRQLKAMTCNRLHIVFGMVDDKDIDSVLAMMPQDARYYFTKADSKRALPNARCNDWQKITDYAVSVSMT